tara:strand:+ start:488 stop:805 length:318 start_codon:yes stop_codon:yes gene_type:complete
MPVEQAAQDLLAALESLYLNDFNGYQCNRDEGDDIDAARAKLEEALAQPQPQREWVVMTDEEIKTSIQKTMVYYGYKPEHSTLTSGAGFYVLARAIEARLKEKNT